MEDSSGEQQKQVARTTEYSSGERHDQELALRAIQLSAVSGFLKNNRRLTESCLVICNLCREYVPLRSLMVSRRVPSTLLAVFCPDLLCAEAEGASRVLLPRRVLKLRWTFEDPAVATYSVVADKKKDKICQEGEKDEDHKSKEEPEEKEEEEEEPEEQEKEEEEEEEEKEKEKEEEEERDSKKKRGPVPACSIDISKVRWPEGLKKIHLVRFNQPVEGAIGPDCLQVLGFHIPSRVTKRLSYFEGTRGIFNCPLNGVMFPAGLRELFLGHKFNQPIDGVAWPEGLERLSMPGFNQAIEDVKWPSGLKTLEFIERGELDRREILDDESWDLQHWGFNQPLGTYLPMGLETLLLSDNFSRPLRGVTWPSKLALLGLGSMIPAGSVEGVKLPSSLRKIVCSGSHFSVRDAPPGCKVLRLAQYPGSDMDEVEFYEDTWDDINGFDDYDCGYEYEDPESEDPESALWL